MPTTTKKGKKIQAQARVQNGTQAWVPHAPLLMGFSIPIKFVQLLNF
jgi:hypothetical protein